jgi:hypothetical protein
MGIELLSAAPIATFSENDKIGLFRNFSFQRVSKE